MPIQTHPNPTSHASILLLCLSLLLSHSATAQKTPPPPSPPSSEYNFSPPMATAVIILIIFFFSVGFISVYIRHFMLCLGYTPGRGFNGGIEAWRNERSPRGLDPKIVDMFPTFLYSEVKMHRIGKSLLECAICLNEFTDLETLRMLPSCSHVFHPHCVGPWLASHVTCPVCRANLENQSSDRSLSFNYLTQQFEQSSSEEDEIESSRNNNHDVIVRVGTSSPEDKKVITITSPVIQEITRMDRPVIKLPRSHSTGHSLVEDCERYTLRLPDEVRNKLVNAKLSGLPAAIVSPPVGYRARIIGCPSIGVGGGKPDHWRFSVSPPFISRASSTKSQKSNDGAGNNSNNESNNNNNNNSFIGTTTSPMNLLKSIKSPFNRTGRSDDTRERSTNRLWVSRTSQDLELEAQWHHDQ